MSQKIIIEACPVFGAVSGDKFICRRADTCRNQTEDDWDSFLFMKQDSNGWFHFQSDCIDDSDYYSRNGGVREFLGLYPVADFVIEGMDQREYIKLPPSKIWGLRLPTIYL
tara:strand:+ start:190 stop:522 length:333 start_codon:yes stop_codon:yes gene_type:complete